MPNLVDLSGRQLPNTSIKTFATGGVTTSQISVSGDLVKDRDYLSHIIINLPTSTPNSLTLFDGTTAVLAFIPPSAVPVLNYVFNLDILATSTKGFNITTGSSISCVVVGRWNNG